jgi:hypothetical protein
MSRFAKRPARRLGADSGGPDGIVIESGSSSSGSSDSSSRDGSSGDGGLR